MNPGGTNVTDQDTTNSTPLVAMEATEAVAEPINWQEIAERQAAKLEETRRAAQALYPDGDGNLVAHARRELERAGLLSPDGDYGGMLGRAVLDLVRVFAAEGHSGASAGMAVEIFSKVASFDVLTPITDHPSEWNDVGNGTFQNRRKSSVFWREGQPTWYDLDAPAA